MRPTATLVLLLGLGGCTGFGEFLSHTVTLPPANPNLPMADSANIRRVLGQDPEMNPLTPEPGNVWPAVQGPDPTLADLQREYGEGLTRLPSTGPDATPRRPRGSSTPPPEPLPSNIPSAPSASVRPPPVRTPSLTPSPQGQIVQTPGGPAVDAGGTRGYRQLTTPQGPGAIMVPNGNGTSTIINPNGTVQVVPTPR